MSWSKRIRENRIIHVLLLTGLTLLMALPGLSGLQVIDRDEARYAQASIQMAESGDYINIRFQDKARNKKPAGIYWMQTAAIKTLSDPDERKIWVQRLPSVLGAILAVLATYWGGVRLIGREGAMIAAALLAVSLGFVFEAHIAKTDAVLCGLSALTLGCFAHLRNGGGKIIGVLAWVALGLSVMIKGPVVPAIALLAILVLLLRERKASWLKPLLSWPGPILFLLIVLPWTVLIWQATDGQFFQEAIGNDFGGKLVSAQEKHPGPPGYYLAIIWAMFWPSSLFMLPGLAFAFKAVRHGRGSDAPVIRGIRLMLAWVIPMWVILEFIPTKLPHYTLPLFPALAILAAAAVMTLFKVDEFRVARKLGAVLFALVSIALCTGILYAETIYGSARLWPFAIVFSALLLSFYAAYAMWAAKGQSALLGAGLAAIILSGSVYQFIMPSLTNLQISDRVATVLSEANIRLPRQGGPPLISPHFREPSLVYHLGQSVIFDDTVSQDGIALLDMNNPDSENLMARWKTQNYCWTEIGRVEGVNYSKGNEVDIAVLKTTICPSSVLR